MTDPAAIAAFETACHDAQVPTTRAAAEHVLSQLAARPDAVSLASAVAATTSNPAARFHAAVTLRTAAIRTWHSLPPEQRYGPASLRHQLVSHVVANPALSPLERKALLRTAAHLARRAYLEEPDEHRNTFLQQVCATAASADPSMAHAASSACELLELLADEFLAPSLPRSAPALQRDLVIHARARFTRPDGDIMRILRAAMGALSALLSAPSRPAPYTSDFDARALPALATVFRVLTTDVANLDTLASLDDAASDPYSDSTPATEALEAVVISAFARPSWECVIDQLDNILRICFSLTGLYIPSLQSSEVEPEAVAKATQIVTAVAAISQGSYQSPDDARRLLMALMNGVNEQKWSASSAGVVRLAYAEVWRRVSCAHGLNSLERLGPSYMQTFTKDTCEELDNASIRLAKPDADEDVFSMDVVDMLLETWANLALQGDDGSQTSEHPLAEPIGRVVYHFTKMSLRSIGESATYYAGPQAGDTEEDLGFEDMSIADSRLAVAAILTRFVLQKMAPAIAQSLLMIAEKVFQWNDSSAQQSRQEGIPLDLFQEDLYFLIRLTAAVLADEAKGEHPSVPIQFMAPPDEDTGNGPGLKASPHAQMLMSALFEVSQAETNLLERRGVHCEEASPRVGSAILDALSRVTKTYLAPVNGSTAALSLDAIGGTLAMNGRAGCFKKAIEGISQRGFESDVAESAANLLSTLAAGASTYPDIRESRAWETLLQAGAGAYQSLPSEAVQHVGKSLTLALNDVVAQRLLVPAYNSLRTLGETKDRSADTAEKAIATINLLRGASHCDKIGPQTRETLLHSLRAPDGIAASCAKSFGRSRPDVARALIKLADDIVASCLPVLSEQDSRDLLANVITIVKLHTDIVTAYINEASEDDLASDVEEIVSLMSRILDEETEMDVGEACYYGLSTILPIMNDGILSLPAVTAGFFRFTARLVSHHPKNLVFLPPDLCKKVLQTIDLQRGSVEVGFERRSLEAITSVARARLTNRDEGPSAGVVDEALLKFLKAIFDGIASGSAHTTNMDAAADALLPLIHIRHGGTQSAFEELGQGLLLSSGNAAAMRAVIQELGQAAAQAGSVHGFHMTDNGQVVSGEGRARRIQATKSFREAVAKFSSTARKCLLSHAIGTANS